ncbi:Guanylate kinase [Dirofilaria immitis]
MIESETSVQQTVSKFAGEEFDVGNMRTVFAGASKDSMNRTDRVILLIGPIGSNKSSLIDCMCNYFYGAKFDDIRYKIADEIFDQGSTPMKSITKYVFNATAMPFRPIIIDTPEIVSDSGIPTKEATACMLRNFLLENQHIHISALCLVLKYDDVSISKDGEIVQETINLFPSYMLSSIIVFFSSNDEKPSVSPSIKLLLSHLNLNCSKCYFFNDYFLQYSKGSNQNDEKEKQKARLSWNLSMSELDHFCEQIRYLILQEITADDFFNNDMLQHTSTYNYSSIKNFPRERIIPIKLIGQESTHVKTLTTIKDWNLSETPMIKRYVYDPWTTTHKPYTTEVEKEGKTWKYINTQDFDTVMPRHKVHETLINDVPKENLIMKKRKWPSDENDIVYMHMRSTPPPEYSIEMTTAFHQPLDYSEERKIKTKKRMPIIMDVESQQKVLHSQHSKSAVQRQIAKRTSSGSEHSKSSGVSSQQQSPRNRQIKQTEQITRKLDDGILRAKNAIVSQRLNDPDHENYMVTPEMKQPKSPILARLLMSKKKRRHSTSSDDTQGQLDNCFEQPRVLENNTEQILQSPLRSYGRLIHDDEMEEQLQDRTIHLFEESPTTAATVSQQNFHREKTDNTGMKLGCGTNECDQLLNANQLNLEEGLTPHPYKTEPRTVNGQRDKVGTDGDGIHLMEIGKTTYSTWNWINCCFYLLAPLFIFFIIIAIIITLALLA